MARECQLPFTGNRINHKAGCSNTMNAELPGTDSANCVIVTSNNLPYI